MTIFAMQHQWKLTAPVVARDSETFFIVRDETRSGSTRLTSALNASTSVLKHSLGNTAIHLALDCKIAGDVPFKRAAEPQLIGLHAITKDSSH